MHAKNEHAFTWACENGHLVVVRELLALTDGRSPSLDKQAQCMEMCLQAASECTKSLDTWRGANVATPCLHPDLQKVIRGKTRALVWRHRATRPVY